uniref:Uncharacterized protein n=1 Tax=Knipowitschia caucasica TaxID=637954 RepID=A0AAV2JMP6_KNICA
MIVLLPSHEFAGAKITFQELQAFNTSFVLVTEVVSGIKGWAAAAIENFRKCLIQLFTGALSENFNATSERPGITAESQTGEMSAIAARIPLGTSSMKSDDSPTECGSFAQLPDNKILNCPCSEVLFLGYFCVARTEDAEIWGRRRSQTDLEMRRQRRTTYS